MSAVIVTIPDETWREVFGEFTEAECEQINLAVVAESPSWRHSGFIVDLRKVPLNLAAKILEKLPQQKGAGS